MSVSRAEEEVACERSPKGEGALIMMTQSSDFECRIYF